MTEYINLLYDAGEKFADETALVDRGGTRSTDFKSFREMMERMASWIYGKSLTKRTFIPVRFESSMEFAAAVCGIWLSGNVAVPMGIGFPPERVKYISMDCEAAFIIDDSVMDEIMKTEIIDRTKYPESEDDDIALLLYTSGSTGMPKGILHTFAGLYANQQLGKRPVYSTGQRWAMGAPFYFVASVAIYKVLTCGGCVHLMDEQTMRDVRALEEYYEKNEITVGFISPSVLSNFKSRSSALKVVMTGSERLTGQCSKDGYKLFNNYGMSETMGTVCSFLVEKPYETTPVGIPAEGTVWALLDDDMNPVPDGEEGEYCTKGPYTIGYFKDPEATKKLFRGGWLHTGDILKKLPDGNLVYINRKDWMVKINGQRVEPGEIENVLMTIPGIDKAVVKDIKGAGGQVALCAYYTGERLEDNFIIERLEEKLAAYMIPSFFMHLDVFPINQNGKIDRKNLPEPDLFSRKAEYAAPENETQVILCRAFEEALGLDRIGIDDDFFLLGGDSIRVMKLALACPDLEITSKLVYKEKTPRSISAALEKSGTIKQRIKNDSYPLSSSQLGMYIESMNRDGEAVYNNPILLKLGKGVDMEKLCTSVEAVVKAHPFIKVILKTDEDENPIQLRNENEEYSQTIERMSEKELKALIPDLMQPFRLLKDRLFRIRLFETESAKYIFMDLHHIIFDGSSMLIFINDLQKAYDGGALETEVYSGFEVAEDEAETPKEIYEAAEKWYLNTFSGIEDDFLPIPDKNEDEVSFGYKEMDLAIDAKEVTDLCNRTSVTENIYATAAFGVLTALYAGMREALFTTIYNGRDSLKTARTIAMLVKTLPVYTSFDADTDIADYLGSVRDQMLGCMNNDIYPFSELAAKTGISSDLLFVYQGDVLNVGGFAGEDVERIPVMENATGEQLAIQMYKADGMYNVRAEYRSDLYSEEFIEILLKSFENILKKMLTVTKVSELSLCGYDELEKLDRWNHTQTDYDRSQTVVSLFDRAADKYPDNTAVIYEDEKLTYADVRKKSEAIAAYIKSKGLTKGDVVAILIPRGTYQVVASLGALKAGCAYQPLDATYPPERLNFMIKDSAAKLLITDNELRSLITDWSGEELYLEDIDSLPDGTPVAVCEPEDTFILLYTSGSTGVPKGVALTQANLVSFIDWYIDFYEITPLDVVGQYASYGFDACMMDMYPALSAGAAVCIVPEHIRLDLSAMNDYFMEHKVSVAFMTTQVGRQFAVEMENPYLRAVSVGGEKLVSMDPPSGFKLYNGYGPTECTIFSTIYSVTKREDNIPIGKPLSDLKCYVVDQFMHLLPPGALGELIIAGPHVGNGYLNNPEKTAEVFIENPFDDGEYKKAYRTGDVVRFRTDGEIEFIGRRDGQVKIHGFRIELSEVEAVIREYEKVEDATVIAKDIGDDGKIIVAYVVGREPIDTADIADFIREKKPPYMVPSSIMQIDKIPLNQNGKVNKKALPEPVIDIAADDESHVDNILEKELKKVIGEAINLENPPLSTPLEFLGLTSIGVIRLSTKLFKRFGVNIGAKEFKELTIGDIENRILEGLLNGEIGRSSDTVSKLTDDEKNVPLGPAQTGVYLECMKNPESTVYNIPSVISFDKNTDTDKLIKAIGEILKAHPSLFVHFDISDSQVMTIKDEVLIPEIPVLELSSKEAEGYKDSFVRAFHLNRGPLFEFAIVKTEADVRLFADFHHLIFDGFSMNLFIGDLATSLKGDKVARESASYFTYIRDNKAMLDGEKGEQYDRYFAGIFEDFEAETVLTSDLTDEKKTKGQKCYVKKPIDDAPLKKLISELGVTEAGFYLSALDYTLARLTGNDKVYIATISSGRSDIRFSDTYGMFVNTIPLYAVLRDESVTDHIRRVTEDFNEALMHESYPFAEIAAKWGFSPSIMYEYQRGIVEKPDIPGLLGIEGIDSPQAKFALTIRIVDGETGPAVEAEYNDALYSKALIEELLRSYLIVIDKFIRNGRDRVRDISLLDADRENQLMSFHMRDEKPDISPDTLFHTGVERYARISPEHKAICAIDGEYTYKELDDNANRVANALIKRGVKNGDRVILLLPRIAKMFFAIYGVLKTGAAYIPLDPNYPIERVRHIIEDSGASLIITTADRTGNFTDKPATDIDELLQETDITKPDVAISQEDAAYLIYTSGSTGKPKGVILKHRGAANYVSDTPGNILVNGMVNKGHVLTAITTFSFDFSIKEWAAPLNNGLTLSVASDDEVNDAAALARRMKDTGTDVFGATPSRMLALMESDEFKETLKSLKVVICGGEKYPDKLLKLLKADGTDRLIFNTYGPTETTVSSNTQELTGYDTVNVGRPLPGVIEYIVDSDGNEVPPGVIGELYIGGIGVAKGYNDLPEMTAERFVEYKGSRVYRSGDYARWTDAGDVEILGRTDNQIKLRGLRIEIDEVDAVLGAVEGIIRSAVTIGKINGIDHLCAYFTADRQIDIGELKYELSRTLTSYMVPTAYMQLDEMPVTPNGKLDLKSLPSPALYRAGGNEAPTTAAESDYCAIFSKLLHVDDVGTGENFFDLGGTSLLVTNLVIEAAKLGHSITFGDVFDNPTPKELALVSGGDTGLKAVDVYDGEIEGYDYSAIDELLGKNTLTGFKNGESRQLGDVLLTGATGYLGIHILHELLTSHEGRIYCLLRSQGDVSAVERLQRLYFYYFDSNLSDVLDKRLFVSDGDVTDPSALDAMCDKGIATVINCAAVVKHFASGTLIEDVNVGGAKNLIDFCLKNNAAMIQTSTMSVVSQAYEENITDGYLPDERTLYFKQLLDNKYIHSKFLAERAVLEAVANKGLKGKVMRYGNLAARHSDGEFQINFDTNSAMGRLKAYAMLGCAAFDQLDATMEFSPIDAVAKATVMLSETPDECTLFHVFNNQNISMEGIFHELGELGYPIKYVERDEFMEAFTLAENDKKKASELTSIMAYMRSPGGREVIRLKRQCEYTLQVLYRLGFRWPITTWDYIERFVSALGGLGYFDLDDEEDF